MAYSLTWLPQVLEEAGLKVAEVPGWRMRGRGEMGRVRGVMCHHTAGPKGGNMPSLNIITNGRGGQHPLPGPLAQLGLGRDGTYYVVAAGRANHAGAGIWEGITTGNSSFIGIEAENTGQQDDPWPAIQLDAYARGCAAILSHVGATSRMCAGHKEYARPLGRKPDPSFDMTAFRLRVATIMAGAAPILLIPASDPKNRATLRRGDRGDLVGQVQTLLNTPEIDGVFGPRTEAMMREWQRGQGLVPDGIVGPKTWAVLAP